MLWCKVLPWEKLTHESSSHRWWFFLHPRTDQRLSERARAFPLSALWLMDIAPERLEIVGRLAHLRCFVAFLNGFPGVKCELFLDGPAAEGIFASVDDHVVDYYLGMMDVLEGYDLKPGQSGVERIAPYRQSICCHYDSPAPWFLQGRLTLERSETQAAGPDGVGCAQRPGESGLKAVLPVILHTTCAASVTSGRRS